MTESTEQAEAVAAENDSPFTYPKDERDGWEPGEPSLRALAPSAVGGGLIPLAVYYAVRHAVSGDATALAIAGIPAAAWVAIEWARKRRLDPIGAIVLFGFIAGIAASYALGGDAFVLKVRDSVFTCVFGLACLVSIWVGRRPMMFYIGRALSAGDDLHRQGLYDELFDLPPARTVFRIITAVWGVGLICEAVTRILLAMILPTGPFLAVAPIASGFFFAGMFGFTVFFSRWARGRTEEAMDADLPEDGGSMWWWVRFWISRRRANNPIVDLSPSEG